MAFFDQIKDMAKAAAVKSEEFAKTVGKKAEAAMDMQKLSSEIDKKEHFIKDNYMQMGTEIYEKAGAGEEIPAYLQEYCKLIDATQAEIDELQTKIDMIKQEEFGASPAKIPCPHCGAEILASSKFCPECGGSLKQEKAAKENFEAQNTVEDVSDEAVTEEAVVAEPAETEAAKAAPEAVKENVVESIKDAEPADEASAKDADTVLQAEPVEENTLNAEQAKEAESVIVAEAEAGASEAEEITDAEIVESGAVENKADEAVPKAVGEKAADKKYKYFSDEDEL